MKGVANRFSLSGTVLGKNSELLWIPDAALLNNPMIHLSIRKAHCIFG